MSNFKVGNSKFSRFVNGKGFYIALALCLVAIGTAAYIAVNSSVGITDSIKSGDNVSSENTASSIPNWDAEQTNTTVSGVAAGSSESSATSKAETSSTAAASSQNSSSSSSTQNKSGGSVTKMVYAMPVSGSVTTAYSGDTPIYDKTMNDWRLHKGVDLAAAEGTAVKACASGTVSDVKVDDMLGQMVIIDHGSGIKSIYANLTSQVTVKKGQQVEVGDTIGSIGETAQAEIAVTPHLHFEITKNGTEVDPLALISGEN
jgi:murein DD-endopeptidase MepM/ murein hydrolase activator NlpD